MGSRIEGGGGGNLNAKPAMFHAGLSNKFTKRHVSNFHDTTLMAASAAKARAELKMERQANAIEKQQHKIESEMKKVEEITERLQRQQAREAKRLRNRLVYAATCVQGAYRRHRAFQRAVQRDAAIVIQRHWRGTRDRMTAQQLRAAKRERLLNDAAHVIAHNLRVYVCRSIRRHEIAWREYAAVKMQSIARQYHAKRRVDGLRETRHEHERRHTAAVRIQSHVRGHLTRLVYLDVLYLICRIQSAVRGWLVRKRLQWLLSLSIRAIVKLQAAVRGFLTRQLDRRAVAPEQLQLPSQEGDNALVLEHKQPHRPTRQRLLRPPSHKLLAKAEAPVAEPSKARPKGTHVSVPFASHVTTCMSTPVKRSYWLPAGASAACMLPHLPAKRANITELVELSTSKTASMGFDDAAARVVQSQRLRLKYGRHRPARLRPLSNEPEKLLILVASDTSQERQAAEDRQRREEELKKKLQMRKAQEKRRVELEMKSRQEEENEAMERRQMEREEKLVRLHVKTTHRKLQEVRLRRQSMEQQREKRERMEMIREERLMKLHQKYVSRLVHGTKRNDVHAPGEKRCQSPDSVDDDELDSDENRDCRRRESSFVNKKRAMPHRNRTKRAKGAHALKQAQHPQREQTHKTNNQERNDIVAHYASWNFHDDISRPEMVEDEVEFDYGDEFDDVVEETQLTRLIC